MVRAQRMCSVDIGVLFDTFELYSRLLKVQIQTTARHRGCFRTNHYPAFPTEKWEEAALLLTHPLPSLPFLSCTFSPASSAGSFL